MINLRSFFKARRPATSLGALLAALLLPVGSFAPALAAADATAPDWLRSAVNEKLPEYPKDTVAATILDDRQITVNDKGEIQMRVRRAIRVLRPEAEERYGNAIVSFDGSTKVVYFYAWTVTSDGKTLALTPKDATERSLSSFQVFSDDRAIGYRFPEIHPGNVIAYEYVQKVRPYVFNDTWAFQTRIPTHQARLSLQLPAGWEFTAIWANHAEMKPTTQGANQYAWEVVDSPAIEKENAMPPMAAIAGHMALKYFPNDPALRAKSSGSWKDIGIWYSSLTQTSRNSTPVIDQKVADLTAGASDPVAKMKALATYVQRQIRYAAIEIGIGGYQPHTAADVFTNQYGDCKDKATLLGSMLHQIGIQSYYVLIHTDRGFVQPDFPSTSFNHAIVAIKLPDDVPDGVFSGIVNDPQLGRILFFDPTNPYVPLGNLPAYLQDSYGLVIGPNGGQLMLLPLLPAPTNRLLRTATFALDGAGTLTGEVKELRWGGPASDEREVFLENPPSKREEIFEDLLGSSIGSFNFLAGSIGNLDQFDQVLTLDYKFNAEGYGKPAANLMIVRPRVLGDKGTYLLDLFSEKKPRQYPIEFEETTRQDDAFDIKLPSGYTVDELPAPVHVSCNYGTYDANVEFKDGVLHYKRSYVIKDIVVPTEKLGEINDFLRKIYADETSVALLRQVSP